MRYRFSLAERELASLLTALGSVGALLFGAGLMAGAALGDTPRAAAPAPAAAVAMEDGAAPEADADAAPVAVSRTPAAPEADAAYGMGGPGEEDLFPMVAPAAVEAPPAWTRAGTEWALEGEDGEAEETADPSLDWGEAVEAGAAEERPAPPPARDHAAHPPRFSAYDGGGGPYALQVGRYADEETAMEVMGDLRTRGHEAYLYTEARGRGVVIHVRLGRYLDRAAAMKAAETLSRRDQLAAVVVPVEGV